MLLKNSIRFHHGSEHGPADHHEHHHEGPVSPEKAQALMKYMIDHNAHHAEEIKDLKRSVSPDAAKLMEQAVNAMADSVAYLKNALSIIQSGSEEK